MIAAGFIVVFVEAPVVALDQQEDELVVETATRDATDVMKYTLEKLSIRFGGDEANLSVSGSGTGATLASLLALENPGFIRACICVSGMYDVVQRSPKSSSRDHAKEKMPLAVVQGIIKKEVPEAERVAFFIAHGRNDLHFSHRCVSLPSFPLSYQQTCKRVCQGTA